MRDIEFLSPFAGKEKGDKWQCDSMLASQLVNIDKVAVYVQKVDSSKKVVKKEVKE